MLKGDEAALIAAAVTGRPYAEIAAAAGVSVSTVQRALRDPDIQAAVREGRTQQRREAIGRLNDRLPTAIERLSELLFDEDPKIVLRAAATILANGHKFTATMELDERLKQLEGDHLGGEGSW